MLRIGCHLSSAKGFSDMGKTAVQIDANTFQFFTRNPRGGKAKNIDERDVAVFLEIARNQDISPILAHAPYTLNACSKEERTRQFAFETMEDDLRRMEYTPGNLYNFHPGCHVGQGVETGISYISGLLNQVMKQEQTTTVLLETMAGKGSEIGSDFSELREIIDRVELSDKLGICLDTCHVWDGGHDIVNHLEEALGEFDRIIGLDRLKAIHMNDSMNPLGAHKDRHARIGEGHIGLEAMVRIINHPALRGLPFFLETPNDLEGYGKEIALLKSRYVE